jgi:hypothetical protein
MPDLGLVYVQYGRVADAREGQAVFGEYLAHPDFRPGQKQLVDLSAVESYAADFVEVLKLQMQKTAAFMQTDAQTLLVYYAPSPVAMEVAVISNRAWANVPSIVGSVQQDEALALSLLGLPHQTISDLLADVSTVDTP